MKHVLKTILCVFLIVLMTVPVVNAAESTMNIVWKGNYTNNDTELVITFKSPADYIQQVSAVMYDKNVANPTVMDFQRITEVMTQIGEEVTFKIKLGNDLTATDGEYKLNLRGNGYMAAESSETVNVFVLTPNKKAQTLAAVNGATTADALVLALQPAEGALQMDIPSDPAELDRLMNEFIKVRNSSEYNGNFAQLNDVSDAYVKAEVIVYLEKASVTPEGLIQRVEKSADVFGFDKTNPDYILNKQSIYAKVISLKNTYKNTGIKTWQQLMQAIEETNAVEYINNTDIDEIDEAIAKYKNTIGISNTSYTAYLTLTDSGKDKVERQVYASGFITTEEIKTAFENAVTTELGGGGDLGGGSTTPGGNLDISLGGGGGAGGGGGSEETAPAEPAKNKFSDVTENHWASSYVEDLCEKGIISGYPDGTFKPENTVTREEFVKMVVSAAGLYNKDAECEFSDITSADWSYKYVASAKQWGIIGGISEKTFGAGNYISRQDVALIGARILDKLNDTSNSTLMSATTSFADNSEISEYALPGVAALVNSGIINGFEDNTFKPNMYITRAQAAKIIYLIRASI